MPRRARIDLTETFYHIYNRGNKQLEIFLDDYDYEAFMRFVERTRRKYPFELISYSLMPNHYHLEIRTIQAPLWKTMHHLNNLYSGFFNRRHAFVGHVFQNRYNSIPIWENRYLLALSRYIHLNPVKAGLVQRPEDYRWSSYLAFVKEQDDPLLSPDVILGQFGHDSITQQMNYEIFVNSWIDKPAEFDEDRLSKITSWGQRPMSGGTVPLANCSAPKGPSPIK